MERKFPKLQRGDDHELVWHSNVWAGPDPAVDVNWRLTPNNGAGGEMLSNGTDYTKVRCAGGGGAFNWGIDDQAADDLHYERHRYRQAFESQFEVSSELQSAGHKISDTKTK